MKRLILCCDGTWSRADQEFAGRPCPTNVVRLGYRLAKLDAQGVPQIVYYDQGVGTGSNLTDRLTGGAFGRGLDENLYEAYRFLVANYVPGDEIHLFGFSRGAFTARSIAGMIRKCGILRRDCLQDYRRAIELYRNDEHPEDDHPRRFRADTSVSGAAPIPIRMIGVWDTVGALGIPVRGLERLTRHRYQFHDTELSSTVEHACHALAIDERRAPFQPTLWSWKPKAGQTVQQVWFVGSHSDVGGGAPRSGLSDIALGWMMDRARAAGLAFDAAALAAHPLQPDVRERIHVVESLWGRALLGESRRVGLQGRDPEVLDVTQSLHPTVLQRWDQDPGYRPRGLLEYLQRIGDPRVQHSAPRHRPA